MLTVTDLCDYSWCPYSLYLRKVQHIRPPPTASMVRGTIIHAMKEQCNRTEPVIAAHEIPPTATLADIQEILFRNAYAHAKNALVKLRRPYEDAGGDALELLAELKTEARYDSLIKAATFKKACASMPYETALEMAFPTRSAELPLHDKGIGLRGRIDAVEEPQPGVMIPVDYKTGAFSGEVTDQQRLQIGAYTILIERVLGCSSPLGLIVYTGFGVTVPVVPGERGRQQVYESLEAAKKLVLSKKEPEKKEGKRCSGCIYAPYCT